jgi:Na+/H+ antiporter NhaC
MGNCYLFGGSESIICSLQQNKNAFLVLCTSGGITLCIAFLLALYRKQITVTDVPRILASGFRLMMPVIILIILASALGSILRLDLQTGRYLAQHLLHTISIAYLPFIFFVAGALCSSLIGLGWGSIALLLPIGVPMTFSMANSMGMHTSLSVIIPTIGAILAGSVFGDHTSPTSAAGEIAAASSGCTALEHAKTQYPYAIPPFLGAGIAYLITGQMLDFPAFITAGVSLAVGALCTLLIILGMQRFQHTQSQ